MNTFKKLIVESGYSSYMYLQNVFSASHPQQQGARRRLGGSDEQAQEQPAHPERDGA